MPLVAELFHEVVPVPVDGSRIDEPQAAVTDQNRDWVICFEDLPSRRLLWQACLSQALCVSG